jgi:hypothetical protein
VTSALTLYNSACTALAEARTLLDAKDVADKAAALKELARLTNERPLEIHAADLRIRSERRLGEMLAQVGLHRGGRPSRKTNSNSETISNSEPVPAPTLEELGIDPKLSMRAQKLASIPDSVFATRIASWRDKAERAGGRITAKLLRDDEEKPPKELASPLKASGWSKATPEQRREFVLAVKPSELVAAVGASAFYRGLSRQQRSDFDAELDAEWQASQQNGKAAHP